MFGLGFSEMLVILLVALVAIGPKKLPGVAKALGRGMAEFRSAMDEMRSTVYTQVQKPMKDAMNAEGNLKETSAEYLDRLLAEREKEKAPATPEASPEGADEPKAAAPAEKGEEKA